MVECTYPGYSQITILLIVALCSSLAYFMMTHPLPIAGKLPIKTLVAKHVFTYSILNDYTLCLYFSHRESRVFLEVVEPQDVREFLDYPEMWAHVDPMEIQYEHIYHSYNNIAINYYCFIRNYPNVHNLQMGKGSVVL